MKTALFSLSMIMFFTLNACSDSDEDTKTSDLKPLKNNQKFVVAPFDKSNKSEYGQKTDKAVPRVANSLTLPIPMISEKKSPRLDLVGPQGTQIAVDIYFDDRLVCSIAGTIDAQTHRRFGEGFIVDGACHGDRIVSEGRHEYKLSGRIVFSDKTERVVSWTTGQRDVSGVIEPLIEVNKQGQVTIKLTVG